MFEFSWRTLKSLKFVLLFLMALIVLTVYYFKQIRLNVNRDISITINEYYNFLNENKNKISDARLSDVEVSEILPNCGILYECEDGTFPVHIYTGQDKDDVPKLCVSGKYVKGIGRGLNIAVVESTHVQLVSIQNFDLYSHSSSALETWLENELATDDIIIAFTFDEASKELSKNAKAILYKLGSGKIQDLQFRCQWYMISQKGIDGFTSLENITYAKNNHWGEAIDTRICVPGKINSIMISPDPYPRININREHLCKISKELQCDHFCESPLRHEPLTYSQLTNRSLIGNVVYSTPIIVLAGSSLSTLALTLESLIYQPGIHPYVFVVHLESQKYVPYLTKIFNFRNITLDSTYPLTSNDKIEYGLQYISRNVRNKSLAIIIQEGLILSPDFLYYMAQLAPVLLKDETLLGISAWNPYGYKESCNNPYFAYRVEDFPGLGFMIELQLFKDFMEKKMHFCCSEKSHIGWSSFLKLHKGKHIIIPDVSRVLKRPKDLYDKAKFGTEFYIFTKPRLTNTESEVWIENPNGLLKENYNNLIGDLINRSAVVQFTDDDLKLCNLGNNVALKKSVETNKGQNIITILYREDYNNTHEKLKAHMKCFGIFIPENYRPQTIYEKVTRIFWENTNILLMESSSIFSRNCSKAALFLNRI